nr:hypothetical protein [Variovorax sp. PAMC26660]
MTVSLDSKMANGKPFFQTKDDVSAPAAKWTQLQMDIINASPALAAKYESSAAANVPYVISTEKGIFFEAGTSERANGVYISQDYFRTGTPEQIFYNSLYIAIEGGHELQHDADNRDPSIGMPQIGNYKSPGDYSLARGVIEGRAVAFEALADSQLQGKKFVVNGRTFVVDKISFSAGGDGSSMGLDFLLAEIYANPTLTAVQKFERAALGARDSYLQKTPSTSDGGVSYFEQNMRAFAQAFTGFKKDEISSVTQDDNGYWTVTASTNSGSILNSYDPRATVGIGAPRPRPNSQIVTSNLDGGATLIDSINYDTNKEVIQLFDVGNNLIRRTEIAPWGASGGAYFHDQHLFARYLPVGPSHSPAIRCQRRCHGCSSGQRNGDQHGHPEHRHHRARTQRNANARRHQPGSERKQQQPGFRWQLHRWHRQQLLERQHRYRQPGGNRLRDHRWASSRQCQSGS